MAYLLNRFAILLLILRMSTDVRNPNVFVRLSCPAVLVNSVVLALLKMKLSF
jgi:hypothetical protein